MKKKDTLRTLEGVFLQGIRMQRRGGLRKVWKFHTIFRHAVSSWLKRRMIRRRKDLLVPIAVALSPTMRCNLACEGCYACDYPNDDEISIECIESLLSAAENMGVFLFVITGGEPLMKDGILEVFGKHKRLLFLMVTNGTLIDKNVAETIAGAGNIIPVVSIEGDQNQTDLRRGRGVYDRVKSAMSHLENAGVVFGFSAMVTSRNFGTLTTDQFVDEMVDRGCSLGFYTEYIPTGSLADWNLVLEVGEQKQFRQGILEIRRNKPLMAVHMPDDEYGAGNKCMGVVGGCFHINSQGYVEPCPFTHFASNNIREESFEEILRSEFLAQVRSSDAIVRRGHLGCALFENREMLAGIISETGAKATDCPLEINKKIRK